MSNIFVNLLTCAAIASPAMAAAAPSGVNAPDRNGEGPILHAWSWSFNNIAKHIKWHINNC